MRYDTVRSRTWTAAPTDVPAKTSSRPTQSCFTLGTIARSRRKGGQRHVGACGMVARLRAPLDRALLGRRRALFPAAPRLVGRPARVGRGRARRALLHRPERRAGARLHAGAAGVQMVAGDA